jgi:hypothetical protein
MSRMHMRSIIPFLGVNKQGIIEKIEEGKDASRENRTATSEIPPEYIHEI